MRDETLKLFYFTNTLVLQVTDFENHNSPIFAPPLAEAKKLQYWRDLVGAEAVLAVRNVDVKLQYHYLGSGSEFALDQQASSILRCTFHPSAVLKIFISIHLPFPDGTLDRHGKPLVSLDVIWTIGETTVEWEKQVVIEAREFMDAHSAIFRPGAIGRRLSLLLLLGFSYLEFHRSTAFTNLPSDRYCRL